MLFRSIARVASQGINIHPPCASWDPSSSLARCLSSTARRANQEDDPRKDPNEAATINAPKGTSGDHEGKFARTDKTVQIPYPSDGEMPRQPVVQGRGGMHFKRTLASFSLENKISLVTGGARGLGLVMAQGLVASGSDLAIVDLNSLWTHPHTRRSELIYM